MKTTLGMIILTKITIDPKRRKEIKQIVLSALCRIPNLSLPVKIKALCKSYPNIKLIPFSVHMKRHNLTCDEMSEFFGTRDSCVDYYAEEDCYIIYYNDVDTIGLVNSNRYRWNIAHELGHVLLLHHLTHEKTRIFRNNLSNQEYNMLETEADYFAQLILVPHIPLYAFGVKTSSDIMRLCQISGPAAYHRYRDYIRWIVNREKNDPYDKEILSLYYGYIFKKECTTCGASLVQRHRYCPICGNQTLKWGDGKMIYPKLDTYKNGKLKVCPKCNNEETDFEGDYCHICGFDLVNRCSIVHSCGRTLPSNARYCPSCGNNSTFYNNNILRAWNYFETPFDVPDEGFPFN